MKRVAIIGYGYVGKAYKKVFRDAIIYDEPLEIGSKEEVNKCDLALVAVPTNARENGELDTDIVESVVKWLETPLILIKSALQPGTVDKLVKKYQRNIAVSVEMVGEGNYFIPYWKYPSQKNPISHNFLIIGGEKKIASACADILWEKMSPDINIHITTAIEAEIVKLFENTWGALKVTFANTIFDLCQSLGADYKTVLQAWGVDGRTEKMHMRVLPYKRGWKSKCFDKDVPALAKALQLHGCNNDLLAGLLKANQHHLGQNDTTAS